MRWLRRTWIAPSTARRLVFSNQTAISKSIIDSDRLLQPATSIIPSRNFGSYSPKGGGGGGTVTRDWLARIWRQDIKQWKEERAKVRENQGVPSVGGLFASQVPSLDRRADEAKEFTEMTTPGDHKRTEIISGERKLKSLLSRSDLVIARDIEWANVLFSFEQESRYMIMDTSAPDSPVGYIRETSNVIFRQLLRTRRPFVAHIIDSHGNEIFRVRRPFWLINSTIYAEVDGQEIGVVHRRWHLWRRIYDLYLGNRQFAVVENPGFWNWTFTLKDEEDNVLAQVDRNWRGIGLELFTDAGQYVIRFGGPTAGYHDGSDDHIEKLEVARPLTLPERAVALALAVSLDCDYFSRRGGWGLPIMVLED